jgi:hypothetical protein
VLLDVGHEGNVAGEVGIGPLAGADLGGENPAAVVDPGDADPFAFLEFLERLLDGDAVHTPAEEHHLGARTPVVAVHHLIAAPGEGGQSSIASREEAGEVERGAGLGGGPEDAQGHVGLVTGEFRGGDGHQLGVLGEVGVPDDAGIDGAQLHVIGDVVDGGFEDLGLGGERLPEVGAFQGGAGDAADGGGVGVGEGHGHFGALEIVEALNALGIAASDHDDRGHAGDR